jgi:hypothetical protein
MGKALGTSVSAHRSRIIPGRATLGLDENSQNKPNISSPLNFVIVLVTLRGFLSA